MSILPLQVLVHIEEQSPDIGQGVHGLGTKTLEEVGAGDQGHMFGYATDETEQLMPLTHVLATQLGYKLTEVRHNLHLMTVLILLQWQCYASLARAWPPTMSVPFKFLGFLIALSPSCLLTGILDLDFKTAVILVLMHWTTAAGEKEWHCALAEAGRQDPGHCGI